MTPLSAGILAAASYVPPARLPVADVRRHWPGVGGPGGIRSVSVAGYDEDVVTLAAEVVDAVLSAAGTAPERVDALFVASCSAPYSEHSSAAEVARAVGLSRYARLADFGGSTLGGVAALAAAFDAVASGSADLAVVVAAERRRGAQGTPIEALGSASVAYLVGREGPVTMVRSASWRHGVPTRWRPDGEPALLSYDDARFELHQQILPAVREVAGSLGVTGPGFGVVGPLDARAARTVAAACSLGDGSEFPDLTEVGDLGSAAPLLALSDALAEAPLDSEGVCLAVDPGAGAQGVALRVDGRIPLDRRRPRTEQIDYVEFLRRFGVIEGPKPPEPVVPWASTPGAMRDDPGGLVGGRCSKCGSLSIPVRPLCVDCGAGDLLPVPAPRTGSVVTYNNQHIVALHPEPAPVAVGVIRLSGEGGERGGQVSAMFCDSRPEDLAVGADVELVYRRLGVDEGLVKYGWKGRLQPGTCAKSMEEGR